MIETVDRFIPISRLTSSQHTIRVPIYESPKVTPCVNHPKYPIQIKEAEYEKQHCVNLHTLKPMAIWKLAAVSHGVEINENDPVWENVEI